MRLKLSVLAGIIACSLMSIAQAEPWYNDSSYSFEGAYVGLLLGGAKTNANFKAQINGIPGSQAIGINTSEFEPGLAVGIANSFNRWYMGLELSSQPVNQNKSFSYTDQANLLTDSVQVGFRDYGNLDFMPGYYFTPTVFGYLRVGAAAYGVSFKQQVLGMTEYDQNSTVLGGRLGVGFDVPIGAGLSAGADYIYTRLTSTSTSGVSPFDGFSKEYNISNPSINTFNVHLRYNFM